MNSTITLPALLSLILVSRVTATEELATIEMPEASAVVYVWTDPGTAQEYLIVERHHRPDSPMATDTLAITPRLPASSTPRPPAIPQVTLFTPDDTYEYAVTQTTWQPQNGWERIGSISPYQSRYRRGLHWNKEHLERAP